jgi:hypothetical protein
MVSVIRRRLRRWGWLLRYWALDKYRTELLVCVWCAATVSAAIVVAHELMRPPPAPGEPVQALAWFGWLLIALVASFIVLALLPKPQAPDPQEGQAPETKDGKQLVRVYGTVWIDDPAIAGWVNNTPEPIRRRSRKK